MAEIDDATLETMQKGFSLLQRLSTDPKTKRAFEAQLKTLHPEIETTEDVAAAYAAPHLEKFEALATNIGERLAKMDERDAKTREAEEVRETEDAFARLRAGGYTDDGLGAIRTLMVDRRIADPEAAAALFDKQNPKMDTRPAAWEPDSWNYQERAVENDMEGLLKNPDRWADKQVALVLNEMRRGE